MSFNANKTKFVIFHPRAKSDFSSFFICDCGCVIEIVNQWSQLGHVISSKSDDLYD